MKPWSLSVDDIAAEIAVDLSTGLTSTEARQRLDRDGPNQIAEEPATRWWLLFARQFGDAMIGLLIVATIVSAMVGDWADALLIATIILANGTIGFVQERRAEHAVAALKRLSQPQAIAVRDGTDVRISATKIVVGDIIKLAAGAFVSADARLIEAPNCQVDEAPLTGESMPVDKQVEPLSADVSLPDRTNMIYSGTAVTRGRARAVVTATANQTELGNIATLLERTHATHTPLQTRLASLSKRLALAVVLLAVLVFCVGWLRGVAGFETLLLTAISLAVAGVPEGLPAVITITLALGSQRMARRNAIVRQLSAVETLGSVDVICTDKTGTLTQNAMSLRDICPTDESGDGKRALLTAAVLCNDAQVTEDRTAVGSATEAALINGAVREGINVAALRSHFSRIGEFPFDSNRKLMSTLHRGKDGSVVVYVKGAPEALLSRSGFIWVNNVATEFTAEWKSKLHGKELEMAQQGQRLLALAKRDWLGDQLPGSADACETDLILLGFVGIVDPLRPKAKAAVDHCHSAGVRVIMITGDHQQTATAIANELNLLDGTHGVMTGQQLKAVDANQLATRVQRVGVFARVSPVHKLRIVQALQSNGNVVAMTGDGVNDAPALKQADIGVAMGITGTDVSREAARMVLADDNFATIVSAIEEGRAVYDNIRKFIIYLLTTNLSEIVVIVLSLLVNLPLPLLPVHLLWINLVTDGLPALALGFEPAESGILTRPPRSRDESLLPRALVVDIVLFGSLIAAICFGVYWWALRLDNVPIAERETYARACMFTTIVMAQLWFVLGLRSSRVSAWQSGWRNNWRLTAAVVVAAVLQLCVLYIPQLQTMFHTAMLSLADLTVCVCASIVPLIVYEIRKLYYYTAEHPQATDSPERE